MCVWVGVDEVNRGQWGSEMAFKHFLWPQLMSNLAETCWKNVSLMEGKKVKNKIMWDVR